MTPGVRKAILWGAALLLGIGVSAYLATQVDWAAIGRLTSSQMAALIASTLVLIILHAFGAAALLKGMGHRAGMWRVMAAMLAAGAVSLAGDPKLGIPARLAYYRLLAGISIQVGAAAVTVESLLWLLLMGGIVAIPGPLAAGYALPLSLLTVAAIAGGLAVIALGPALFEQGPLVERVLGRFGGFGRLVLRVLGALSPVRRFVLDVRKAIFGISPVWLGVGTVWLALTYAVEVWTVWYIGQAMGVDLPPIAIGHAIVISYLLGAASLLPLGLGVRDATFALLLTQAGAPPDVAALIALLHRTLRTILPLILGFGVTLAIIRWVQKDAEALTDDQAISEQK